MRDLGRVPLSELSLDPQNPRLPEAIQGATEAELLEYIFDNELLDELAASFVANGYFDNEPVLVLRPNGDGRRPVVEGNRRVSALKILLQEPVAQEADLAFDLATPPTEARLSELRAIPAFEVEHGEQLDAYLGFRHIGGLRQWSAEAKARWIHKSVREAVVAGSIAPFYDVGRVVGSNARGVRTAYTTLELLQRARVEHAVDTTHVERHRYSVWGLLVGNSLVREYVGLNGDAREYLEIEAALERVNYAHIAEIVGDLTPQAGQRLALLPDSRLVSQYAEVLANPRAHDALRRYDDLQLAISILEMGALTDRLRSVARTLREALIDAGRLEVDAGTVEAAGEVAELARSIRAVISDRVVVP